jgi:hypothetical protein
MPHPSPEGTERKQLPRLGQPVRQASDQVVSGQQNQAASFGEFGLFGVVYADHMKLTGLTTTERDALIGANGMIIYNSTTNKFQGYENGAWANLI